MPDGAFSITVPTGKETLVFTYVGFIDQEVSLQSRTTLAVTMALALKITGRHSSGRLWNS
jgi:hypothetical protein